MPLHSIRHNAMRAAVAAEMLSKSNQCAKNMVFLDCVSLGMTGAGLKDVVWAARYQDHSVGQYKFCAKGARCVEPGCLSVALSFAS